MYATAVKSSEDNKSKAIANNVGGGGRSIRRGFGFLDNRQEVIAQRKLLEMSNNSSKAQKPDELREKAENNYAQKQVGNRVPRQRHICPKLRAEQEGDEETGQGLVETQDRSQHVHLQVDGHGPLWHRYVQRSPVKALARARPTMAARISRRDPRPTAQGEFVQGPGLADLLHTSTLAGPLIQRRLLRESAETAALTDDGGINLEGIRQLIRMTLKEINQKERTDLDKDVQQNLGSPLPTLLAGGQDDVNCLSAFMRTALPGMVYGGPDLARVAPKSDTENKNLYENVIQAYKILADIGNSAGTDALKEVFGDSYWAAARKRFAKAADVLKTTYEKHNIFVDRSGERDQMMVGGTSDFNASMILKPETFDASVSKATVVAMIHEVFHTSFSDILDNGGYPSEDSFPTRSAEVKFRNAAHYEEVARRVYGFNPVGGVFIPAEGKGATSKLTTSKEAVRMAADTIRLAWERAQNVHGLLKHQLAYRNILRKPLLFFASLLGLPLYKRERAMGAYEPVKVQELDVLLTEGITRNLAKAMQVKLPPLFATLDPGLEGNLLAMRNHLVREAFRAVGPVTGSVEREMNMAFLLSTTPRNPADVVAQPPRLSNCLPGERVRIIGNDTDPISKNYKGLISEVRQNQGTRLLVWVEVLNRVVTLEADSVVPL